jgi:hypothetical protein
LASYGINGRWWTLESESKLLGKGFGWMREEVHGEGDEGREGRVRKAPACEESIDGWLSDGSSRPCCSLVGEIGVSFV